MRCGMKGGGREGITTARKNTRITTVYIDSTHIGKQHILHTLLLTIVLYYDPCWAENCLLPRFNRLSREVRTAVLTIGRKTVRITITGSPSPYSVCTSNCHQIVM